MSKLQTATITGLSVFVGVLIFELVFDPLISNRILNLFIEFTFLFVIILLVQNLSGKKRNK
ncbi:MAG: hypothetical protein KC455_11080 [Carnobacterium sp.]|nr:hypothetical protein [Carnobacterium sp.]